MVQWHSRCRLLLVFTVTFTVLYFTSPSTIARSRIYRANTTPADPTLPSRLRRAEQTYQTVLHKRRDLIKKYGPSPAQITT
jgi:hypothetical protein